MQNNNNEIRTSHWGELEDNVEEFDISKETKTVKSKVNLNNFEVPPLYQPSSTVNKHKKEYVIFFHSLAVFPV